jgi:hypothetical protein
MYISQKLIDYKIQFTPIFVTYGAMKSCNLYEVFHETEMDGKPSSAFQTKTMAERLQCRIAAT